MGRLARRAAERQPVAFFALSLHFTNLCLSIPADWELLR